MRWTSSIPTNRADCPPSKDDRLQRATRRSAAADAESDSERRVSHRGSRTQKAKREMPSPGMDLFFQSASRLSPRTGWRPDRAAALHQAPVIFEFAAAIEARDMHAINRPVRKCSPSMTTKREPLQQRNKQHGYSCLAASLQRPAYPSARDSRPRAEPGRDR